MTAPESGDNIIGWVSAERYIPLTDMTAFRARVYPETQQTAVNAIPLWDISYDNFNISQYGNTYGGEVIFIDTAGGANGIRRAQGRSSFEVWAMPLAAQTPQWRGTLPGGGNENAAFTPHNDASNDIRLSFRELDLDSAGVAANLDWGTICISGIRITAFPLGAMNATSIWSPAIGGATHSPQTISQAIQMAGAASIDETAHEADYQLTGAPGAGNRKTLIPFESAIYSASAPYPSLFPVQWETDTLYKGTIVVRSNVNGGAGSTEGTDPLDTIFVNMDTADSELVNIHVALIGSPDNMYHAASPRLPETVGNVPQMYSSFYWGHNVTAWPSSGENGIPGIDHFRIQADLFNTPEINPGTVDQPMTGADPVSITAMYVERVTLP